MKKNLILLVAVVVAVFTFGVTYAFFTYSKTSDKSNVMVTGDIYLVFNEGTDVLSIANAMPMSDANGKAQTKEFEFTIVGKNQSSKAITYNIYFSEGDDQKNTRLEEKFIKLNMTQTIGSTVTTVIDAKTYDVWDGVTSVYQGTIPANTNSEVKHIYKLKMWITDSIWVSDTDAGADYTTQEFNSSYQSLKVKVDAVA